MIEWNEAKVYLQSPIFLVNQLTKFKDFCDNGLINSPSIARAYSLISHQTTPEEATYISEILETIEQFVRSAIEYFIMSHPAYSYDNLHLFDPVRSTDGLMEVKDVLQKVSRSSSPRSTVKSITTKSRPLSPTVHDSLSVNRAKTSIVRSKTPTNLRSHHMSTDSLQKLQGTRIGTPTHQMRNERSLSSKSIKPQSPISRNSSSGSPKPQRISYSGSYAASRPQSSFAERKTGQGKQVLNTSQNPYKHVKSRYMDAPAKKLQERNQAILNRSYGEFDEGDTYRNTTALKFQSAALENKFRKSLEQKTMGSGLHSRQKSLNTTSFERSSINDQRVQQFNVESEVQANKKATREFKQKATKLLVEHDRMVYLIIK